MESDEELRNEYDANSLKNGVRGIYAQRLAHGSNVVRLAPVVAVAFPTEEAVNEALVCCSKLPNEPFSRHRDSSRTGTRRS